MPIEPLNYATPASRPGKVRFWMMALLVFSPTLLLIGYLVYVVVWIPG